MAKRISKWIVGGVGLSAILALYILGYRKSKSCTFSGHEAAVVLFFLGPPLIGLVVGATLPRRVWVKVVCAIGFAVVAFVFAFGVLLKGEFAGQCGGI